MIQSLQAGRGIAAVMVLFYHMQGMFADSRYWGARPVGGFFDFGFAGVHFFFVLSGFIIALSHWDDIGTPAALRGFAWKRFSRVYPFYWAVTGVILLTYTLLPTLDSAAGRTSAPVVAGSFTLLPFAGVDGVLAVSWTLFHEVAFYCVFAVLILNRGIGILAFGLWLLLIGFSPALPESWSYLASPLNLLFFLGIACFWLYKNKPVVRPGLVAMAGVAMFAVFGSLSIPQGVNENWFFVLGFGMSAAIGILGFAALEIGGALKIPKVLIILGSASYSIYLIHYPLIALMGKLLIKLGLREYPGISWLIVGATAIAFGILAHYVIERPLTNILRRRLTRPAVACA